MDSRRFDAFTRTLSSRRSALAGLAAGVGALLGFALPEEANAHNFLARCRRIRHPGRRGRCLRQAQEHNFRHRYCRILAPREACSRVDCGIVRDGCGNATDCGPCASVHTCSSNNSCAFSCLFPGRQGGCPDGCTCSSERDSVTGDLHCLNDLDPNLQCNALPPTYCTSTTDCRIGYKCEPVPCGPGGALERRCVATCA